MIRFLAIVLLGLTAPGPPEYTVIPGSFEPGRGPDGNSVLLDTPEGLILVDTGRHQAHQDKLFAQVRAAGKPVVAIVNTHWHLDHSGGNRQFRTAFPEAPLYASDAVEAALAGFFLQSRKGAEEFITSGKASAAQMAEIRRDMAVMDDAGALRATRPVARTERVVIGGRPLTLHLAPYAATEGDVWIEDARARLVIAGDLVVAPVPFMDTACPDGWRRALDAIAAVDFETLVPGHGDPMTRAQFEAWRAAYGALLDCARSTAPRDACIAGWREHAAAFIPAGSEKRIDAMVGYYLDTRLRAPPAEAAKYCG